MPRPKKYLRNAITAANMKLSIKTASLVLASSTLVSALLGIFRDRLLNSMYYDTYPAGLDAYTTAFTVPDFLYFIITSGALSVTFIPILNERLVEKKHKEAWDYCSSLLNFLAILCFIASVLIIVFADPLVRYVVAPGLNESSMALAINMMRVIAINPFLFSISTVFNSVQQAVGRFVFCALAPALYNVGIIIGVLSFTNGINIFGWQVFDGGIMGVALGVVLGALLQLVVSVIGLVGLGFNYGFKINWKNKGFRTALKLLPMRSMDQGIDYITGIFNTNLASRMGEQSIRAFQQASSLQGMPVSLIGVAISTAYFSQLSQDAARKDKEIFMRTFRKALRAIAWIAMPVAVFVFFERGYVVNFIKNGGDPKIASVLGSFVVSIFCTSCFHIASRGFYARQDTRTPFTISVVTFIVQSAVMLGLYKMGFGPEGLAYAVSFGTVFELTGLLIFQNRAMDHKLFTADFWSAIIRIMISSAVAGVACYIMTRLIPLRAANNSFFSTFPKFCIITAVSGVVYLLMCVILRVEEVKPVFAYLKRVLFRNGVDSKKK
ncbi:murein biosynthesis integral membrane protein MurJ [Candidatus Saccharibacteria bacterium]|nr:murein biosynthesis integral membrane protein MurJ [Candidatus Saccharibacteria bacterium]